MMHQRTDEIKDSDFISAKNSVIAFYNSTQVSLATRFFAVIAALFAMVQALSLNFVTFTFQGYPFIRVAIFAAGAVLLLTYALRAAFMYALFSGLSNRVFAVRKCQLDHRRAIHEAIHVQAQLSTVRKLKLFRYFEPLYFVAHSKSINEIQRRTWMTMYDPTGRIYNKLSKKLVKDPNKRGWLICLLFALGFVLPLLFLI
jgi:hypothetical protein